MYKSRKTVAFILSAFMLVTFLFSLVFVAVESDHDCTGKNDCQICEQIKNCLHIFDDNSPKPESNTLIFNAVFAVVLCIGFAAFAKKLNTLINLKVKLSN